MNYKSVEQDRLRSKKIMRIGILSTFSGGIGLATFLLQRFFSGMARSDDMNALIDWTCVILMAYAGAIFAVYIFRRGWLVPVNSVLLYLVIPGFLLKLFTAYL